MASGEVSLPPLPTAHSFPPNVADYFCVSGDSELFHAYPSPQ